MTVVLAGVGRDHLAFLPTSSADFAPRVAMAAPAIAIAWVLVIAAFGGYGHRIFGAGTDEYRSVLSATFFTCALTGIGCYVMQFPLSRGFFVLVFLVGMPLLVSGRVGLRRSVRSARRNGALQQRVLIVGSSAHVDDVAAVLERESWLGYQVIGALTPAPAWCTPAGVRVLGEPRAVADQARAADADIVFFAGGAVESASQLRQIAWDLEHSSTQVVIAPSLTDVSRERIQVRPVGGLPLIHLEKPRSAHAMRQAKRTFDIVGSLMLLLVSSPVFAYAALQIWLHDRGPVFFKQVRIGQEAKPFRCLKFRTMVTDAEARLAAIHDEQGSEIGVFVKIKDDPRVTRPGRWLRRLSLDELPQLVNVLRGDMSLVGPRPQVAHEVARYDSAMARRLHVRPGMTGLWQVSGRSDLTLAEAIRLDLYYVDNWSMTQDLSILARTFGAVVASRGAY